MFSNYESAKLVYINLKIPVSSVTFFSYSEAEVVQINLLAVVFPLKKSVIFYLFKLSPFVKCGLSVNVKVMLTCRSVQ